jgi:predicted alpha-1,2-mannosidase
MIGYHSVSVIADAIVKGIKLDNTLALEACLNSSTLSYYDAIGDYLRLGYVPLEKSSVSASQTLEYAYDDWTIYQLSKRLKREGEEKEYGQKALNYKNVFDRSLGFARPRNEQGVLQEPFDLLETHGQGFIEGNSWNYSFFVPHDVAGLMDEMGGEKRFIERLDSLFTMTLPEKYFAETEDITEEGLMGNYVHGNEPSHHVAYLYAWTSQPWETQSRVHEIMDKMYKNKPDGLCGNDDCGQMSAWYVFSAMGFYPVCPGTDEYVIGSPNALKTTIYLENGKTFTIKAPALNAKNVYIRSVTLNGKPYHKAFLRHQDIMNGGELIFEMSAQPNKERTTGTPYSLSEP